MNEEKIIKKQYTKSRKILLGVVLILVTALLVTALLVTALLAATLVLSGRIKTMAGIEQVEGDLLR